MSSVLTHPLPEQNMFLGKDLTSLIPSLTVRELDSSSDFKEEDLPPSSPLPQVIRSPECKNDLNKTIVDSSVSFWDYWLL